MSYVSLGALASTPAWVTAIAQQWKSGDTGQTYKQYFDARAPEYMVRSRIPLTMMPEIYSAYEKEIARLTAGSRPARPIHSALAPAPSPEAPVSVVGKRPARPLYSEPVRDSEIPSEPMKHSPKAFPWTLVLGGAAAVATAGLIVLIVRK